MNTTVKILFMPFINGIAPHFTMICQLIYCISLTRKVEQVFLLPWTLERQPETWRGPCGGWGEWEGVGVEVVSETNS